MDFLIAPFRYEFFSRAVMVGVMAGLLCGVMGVYITTRRMSYIAHGLSHAILGGAVLSYVLNLNFRGPLSHRTTLCDSFHIPRIFAVSGAPSVQCG